MSLSTSGQVWEEASSPAAIRLARRFESAWRDADGSSPRRPDLDAYLAEAELCPGARLAILRSDLALRWEAGERVSASWYLERFPRIEGETIVALIYEEFCLREESKEGPDPDEYYERYPAVAPRLRRVLEIHGLVGSGQTTASYGGASTAAEFPETGETIGGFRLVEELGRGAFARVFRAQEQQLADRPVALKVARAGSREPQTLARLQHTHIVPVHSYRTDAATGMHLLCMPYFGRVTLARLLADPTVKVARSGADLVSALDRLDGNETPPAGRSAGRGALISRTYPQAIAWWGARMAEALAHAHDRGVLHRDIKPSNVLVTGDGMTMLLDFNLARRVVVEGEEAELALPGGTLDYMSPEHLEELVDGHSDRVDARSDVYGLGVLLYEALMGRRPFCAPRDAASGTELLLRAADDRKAGAPRLRDSRPEVPAAFEAVVRRCLEPAPDHRYASAADLAVDLQAVADDQALRFAREPILDRTHRWVRRHRRAIATSAPVFVALAVILGLLLREGINRVRLVAEVEQLYDGGEASFAARDFSQAMVQFESAARLAVKDDPADLKGRLKALHGGTDSRASLEALRSRARLRYRDAMIAGEVRTKADDLEAAAQPLRFRLTDFGGDLSTTSRELQNVLAPFHVFEDPHWLRWPDLSLLDADRLARLRNRVGELLFLWTVALEKSSRPEAVGRAVETCDRALVFAQPASPWRALKARLTGGYAPTAPDSAAEPPSALGSFQWGMIHAREKRLNDAIVDFKRSVALEPGNYWYQYFVAYTYENVELRAEALRHFEAALALEPRSPAVRFGRARLYRMLNVWALAMEDFERALRDDRSLPAWTRIPDFEARTRLETGLARQSLGDHAGARSDYDWVIASNPPRDVAHAARFNRAKLDADSGAIAPAWHEYDALLEADPGDRVTRLARALLALRQSEPQRAEADLTELLDAGRDGGARSRERGELFGHRSHARLAQGRAADALVDVRAALALAPSPRLDRLHSRALIADGDTHELSLSDPDELGPLPINGMRLRDDMRRLATRLEHAITRTDPGPDLLRMRLTRAVILCALGDPDAETEATRAVTLGALAGQPHLVRARIRRRAGRIAPALEDVDQAIALEPANPQGWALRSVLRTESGDYADGLADIDAALQRSDDRWLRVPRARALMGLGRFDEAVTDWALGLARDPEDPITYLGRAESLARLGKWDQALGDLEQAISWSDDRGDLTWRIALAYARCLLHRPGRWHRLLDLAGRAFPSWVRPVGRKARSHPGIDRIAM